MGTRQWFESVSADPDLVSEPNVDRDGAERTDLEREAVSDKEAGLDTSAFGRRAPAHSDAEIDAIMAVFGHLGEPAARRGRHGGH